MGYVFDTNSFIVVGHYFPDAFPTFWEQFNRRIRDKTVISVREVYRELENNATRAHLIEWIKTNKEAFPVPAPDEPTFLTQIFAVPKFREIVRQKEIRKGSPVADPFIIAAARAQGACVVTEEKERPNAARIPNICRHFGIDCTDVEGFMAREGLRF